MYYNCDLTAKIASKSRIHGAAYKWPLASGNMSSLKRQFGKQQTNLFSFKGSICL